MAKSVAKTKAKVKPVCKAAKAVAEVVHNTQVQTAMCFPSVIYIIERPDFLDAVSSVSDENLEIQRKKQDLNEIYPVLMTESFFADPRLKEFSGFIGATAWNILNEQGYNMQNFNTTFLEMWTQEHHKHSAMDQHIHGHGSQIVGFYFLETPENCSRVVFHDPRAAKAPIDLPEQDMGAATFASKMINFEPKPGTLMFANAWLAHAFTRHAAETPIKFVHFNLGVQYAENAVCATPAVAPADAEVI
jgi:uncharacterized protein (TIGR02466 family)